MDQFPESLQRGRPLRAFRRAIEQLAIGDDGKRRFSRAKLAEAAQNFLRPSLANVDADICVQQIARLHYNPLRFCGLSFSRPGSARSSGRSASRSKARTRVSGFSRKTISSPLRKISTSSVFSRNCFGSRTAWLFPDLNTRAVPMHHLECIYMKYIQNLIAIAKLDSPL